MEQVRRQKGLPLPRRFLMSGACARYLRQAVGLYASPKPARRTDIAQFVDDPYRRIPAAVLFPSVRSATCQSCDQARYTVRQFDTIISRQRTVQQTLIIVFAKPLPEPPKHEAPARCSQRRLGQAMA